MRLPDTVSVITTPGHQSIPLGICAGRPWALDNEMFVGKYDFQTFYPYLERLKPYEAQCLFVACPDEVGDARLTLLNFRELCDWFLDRDWPLAFVAQNGQEDLPFPSPDLWQYLFIAGDTEWKCGSGATACIARAHALGKPIHLGRVNSWQRFAHFLRLGVASVDGSCIRYQRDYYTRQIIRWTQRQALPLPLDEYAYALAMNDVDYDPFDNDWYN